MIVNKRHFRILVDFPKVREFMLCNYQKNWHNGVPAPFFEYALSASWADQTRTHRNAIWEENGKIVAFCFYESSPGTAFFNLNPAYTCLAGDMIKHAEEHLCDENGKLTLQLFEGQDALIKNALEQGYTESFTDDDKLFDLSKPLDFKLPDGYRFVEPSSIDVGKVLLCCWKGFDHESEGDWDGDLDDGWRTTLAPSATPQYFVAIEDAETGEYVCYAGMWWTPENKLAYMEPLCTVPQHRKRGLAEAALSEMARRMRHVGAEWMTGGSNEFYSKIGYESGILWRAFRK